MAELALQAQKWADEMGQLVFECASRLGRELTAYVGGADSPRDLEAWTVRPYEAAHQARERLTTAWRITTVLTAVLAAPAVVAWFREPADNLGGVSPATVLHWAGVRQIHAVLYERAVRHASAARLDSAG
jgi:hypothetical protein